MDTSWLVRTELLIGKEALERLINSHVLVVGLGGVGSYAAESLVRAGLGHITIIDGDDVDPTNKNRQLQALDSNVGKNKANLLKDRFLDINPHIKVTIFQEFMEPDVMFDLIKSNKFDYVMDCIDSVKPKLSLIQAARKAKVKSISAMGAGGKLDPLKIRIGDLFKASECKFAKAVRKRLKRLGIRDNVLAVYSEEIQPHSALEYTDGTRYKRSYYGTISYMPAMVGMTMASEVIKRLTR